jgi:glutamate carboxypeptidase
MSAISLSERAALERAAGAPMLGQVERWALVNSGSRNLAGLDTMAALLADAFSVLPGPVSLEAPAPVEAVEPDGRVVALDHGRHLHVRVRPEAPVQMLFTGHMDTVYGVADPFQALTWQADGTLNGPGVADMKGGIALLLAALQAVERDPAAQGRLGYEVVINADEEVGSAASAALIARAAAGKVAALTYEPALPDGTLAGARAGSGNFSITVSGRSAHAGRNPEEGRNAVLAAADLALRLKAESGVADGHGFSCNPARIDGGGPNNVVPAHAILRVNFRPRLPEDEAAALRLLDAAMTAVARDHDVTLHRHGGFSRPPKPVDPGAERLFRLVGECGSALGIPIARRDTGGVCDGNNIAACGVPVVDTMGVRGGAIHSPDEYLIVESLAERAMLSTLTILRIAERGAP